MKSYFSILVAFLPMIALSACNLKMPGDYQKETNEEIDKIIKDNTRKTDEIKLNFEQGGQPGLITVAGIIVKNKTEIDSRITVTAKGGTGKDGVEVKVYDSQQPQFSTEVEKAVDLKTNEKDEHLYSIGCDPTLVEKYAKRYSLTTEKDIPSPISDNLLMVSGNTILLCGDLADMTKYVRVNFIAHRLVLSNLNFVTANPLGLLTLSANKLELRGSNKIMSKGITALLPALSLSLNVLKTIDSTNDGKLELISIGDDYKK